MIFRYFKVRHRDMVYLKFILEAYEGMNVMSTVDNVAGIIRIAIMEGFEADEYIEVVRVPFDQALAWIADGTVADAKTICALHLADRVRR